MADNNNPIKYSDLVSPDSSITDLIKQLDELSDAYTNALKNIRGEAIKLTETLKGVSGATEEGRQTTRKAVTDADRLAKAERELNFARSDAAIELAKIKAAQREATQIAKLVAKANSAEKDSYDELSAVYSLNKITLNSMSRAMREGTKQGQELEKQTREIYEEMKRLQEATGKTSLNVGNYPTFDLSNIEDQLKQLVGLNNQFGTSLLNLGKGGDAVKSTFKGIGDGAKALGKSLLGLLSNPVFLAIAGIAAAGMAFKFWYDYNAGLVEATRLTQQFTGKEGDDLKNYRNQVQAVADTFNKDFKEVLIASNALSKQFGISADESLQLITDGFVSGADASGEFLDSVKEYPAYFREAGISADQFVAIIAQTTKQGIFSDKGIDAIKEANIRLREMTTATAKALDGIGISSKQVQEDLQNGSKTTFQVMQEVSKKLNELPESSSAVGTAIADIFGGPGEDAGLQYLKTLGDISTSLDDVKEKAGVLGQLQEEQLNSQLELNNTIAALFDFTGGTFETLTTKAKVFVNEGLTSILKGLIDIINYFIDLYNNSVAFRLLWNSIVAAFKTGFDMIGNIFNLFIDTVKATGRILKGVFTLDWDEFKGGLRDFANTLPNLIKASVKDADRNFKEGVANMEKRLKPITIPVKTETTGDNKTISTGTTGTPQKATTEKELEKIYETNLKAKRKYEDAMLTLEKDSFEKQRKQIQYKYDRQIEDLQHEIDTEKNLTESARNDMRNTLVALKQQEADELLKVEQQRQLNELQLVKQSIEMRLKLVKAGTEQEKALKLQAIDVNEQIALLQNLMKSPDKQVSGQLISSTFDTETKQVQYKYDLDEFDKSAALENNTVYQTEKAKTAQRLQMEKERWEEILRLTKQYGSEITGYELDEIEKAMAQVDAQMKKINGWNVNQGVFGNLFDMIFGSSFGEGANGLEKAELFKSSLADAFTFAQEQLQTFADYRLQLAEQAVENADREVEAAQNALNNEIEARNNGYANNVIMAQKELELAKKNQQKAIKEQQKAQKQQAAIQTLQQIGNLVSATALIWAQLGFPWAIPATAVMWASFAAAKIKANQMTKSVEGSESYGEGTVELLSGGSHQSGDDVDLGTKPDGTRRRAEGGEFFAVINKRNSRKYRKIIPDVINSLNNGTFSHKYLQAYAGADGLNVNISHQTDLRELNDNVREIRDQNKRRTYVNGRGEVVETYKNMKRTYKLR